MSDKESFVNETFEEVFILGASISEGVAIGVPYFMESVQEPEVPRFAIAAEDVDREIQRYRRALSRSRSDLELLQRALASEGSQEAVSILDTHIQMLDDPMITTQMEEKIRLMLLNTESIFRSTVQEFTAVFSETADNFFRQRLIDVRDVSKRILDHLQEQSKAHLYNVPLNSVICAQEIAPSDSASANALQVSAFITSLGGINSHAALIARAKGIPYVAGINIEQLQRIESKCVIVDGTKGKIIINPTSDTLQKYEQMQKSLKTQDSFWEWQKDLLCETIDGHRIVLRANIGYESEMSLFHTYGVEGIGLLRTEILFPDLRDSPFLEEDQYRVLSHIVQQAQGAPVVIRFFDFGGDKNPPPGLQNPLEANPILGCRGVRFLLKQPDFFKVHIRAILRCTCLGDVRLLIPLVSDVGEIYQVKALIDEVADELRKEGVSIEHPLAIGCMLEVPSALLMTDVIAGVCDFLSLGTNDLIQYTLGVDRGNPIVADRYQSIHPGVLRLIKMSVIEAKKRGCSISVCGEMASNSLFVPLLIGLGVTELSCSPRFVPVVKRIVRQCTITEAYRVAQRALELPSAADVNDFLMEIYRRLIT